MSEFREDPISGDWIILATGRAKRPEELLRRKAPRLVLPKSKCPFEDLERSGNWPPIAFFPSLEKWKIAVIPNKYPALTHFKGCAVDIMRGVYHAKTGVGDHEIVIARDHRKNIADLDFSTARKLFSVIQERHRSLAEDHCNAYIASFFNWGREAGASVSHPHYQILALPIIPPHAGRSFYGARHYFKTHHRCARCAIIADERRKRSGWWRKIAMQSRLRPMRPSVPLR